MSYKTYTLKELAAAYENGEIHPSWTVGVDNDSVALYAPRETDARALAKDDPRVPRDAFGSEADTVCVWELEYGMEGIVALLQHIGIQAEEV